MSRCPKGQIIRKGYWRKGYTKSNGTYVKRVYIKPSCVPDKGKPGKTPASKKVLPKPRKNALGKYGYTLSKLAGDRRVALRKAVDTESYATIIRRINLIANYTKNSDPKSHRKYRLDIAWIQKNLCRKYSKRPKNCNRSARKRRNHNEIKIGKYKTRDGRQRQLYRLSGRKSKYYKIRKDGKIVKIYVRK